MSLSNRFCKLGLGLAVLSGVILSLNACSGASSSSPGEVKINLNAVAVGSSGASLHSLMAPNHFSSGASGLVSLKYMIRAISICESLTVNGTGFSDQQNCSEIFERSLPGTLMDSTVPVTFPVVNDIQSGQYADYQIDLMDPVSLAKINTSSTVKAGTYNYAIITWGSPISFKAEFGGIKSKKATGFGASQSISVTTASLTSGTAEEAVILSPNGGTFFKLPQPFTVTEADVAAGKSFVVDLVFNPEDVLRGTTNPSDFSMSNRFEGSDGAIYVPMLSLAPVLRESTDTNSKEVYTLVSGAGTYRLELYYNTSDSSKAIKGASLVNLDSNMSDDAKIVEISEAGGALDFTSSATAGPGIGPGGLIKGLVRGTSCSAVQVYGSASSGCTFEGTVQVQ